MDDGDVGCGNWGWGMKVKKLPDFTLFLEAKELQEGVETTIASETSLMKDWLIPEEDAAWQYL